MKPNSAQEAAISGILDDFRSKQHIRSAALQGYAGTGKTTTLGWIVEELRKEGVEILVSAHTHKALSVARGRLPLGVRTQTLFQLLGWRINRNTGAAVRGGVSRIGNAEFVIVDEASMVDAEMYEAVMRAAGTVGAFVLWVGDPAQLPPVGSDAMPAFALTERRYSLTEIVRQSEGSKIIDASLYLRRCLEQQERPELERVAESAGDGSVTIIHGGAHAIADYATSAMSHGLDTRVLGWTNRAVNRAADLIAARLAPGRSQRIEAGDPVVFSRAVWPSVQTDTAGTVISVGVATAHGPLGVACVRARVDVGAPAPVDAWTPLDLDHVLQERGMLTRALSHLRGAKNSEGRAELHKYGTALQALDDAYVDLRHQYALTVHKSQGSTFDVAIVDWQDLQGCADTTTLCRLLYVAATRPSQYLVLSV